ncbi:hypothetical protein NLG97_g8082 [Lecanicillium saksenae]|uniref:Uncharacterized protein n=1 Tax=Lecanicillium saksenae TaxID=468837 RepID=A0ACC1QJX4_9HYPO|nr:hypothetical protein NLG97_g8082 [Lecanicillium saksenae]
MPRLSNALALIAGIFLLPLIHSLTIHEDLPDGVYQINWLPGAGGGIAAWTWYDVPYDVNITAKKFNGKLPLPVKNHDVYCQQHDHRLENITMVNFTRADDQHKAMAMLANWCEMATYVHKDAMVLALYNDMAYYVCNWDNMYNMLSNAQRCSKAEIYVADAWMDAGCGIDKRAELSIGLWQKTYGRSHRFGDICEKKDTWNGS